MKASEQATAELEDEPKVVLTMTLSEAKVVYDIMANAVGATSTYRALRNVLKRVSTDV